MSGRRGGHQFQTIRVVDVELSRPIESMDGLSDYSRFLALIRLHESPIGYVKMPVNDGCWPAESLLRPTIGRYSAAIIRHLWLTVGVSAGDQQKSISEIWSKYHTRYTPGASDGDLKFGQLPDR